MAVEFYGGSERPSAIVVRAQEKVEGIKFFSPSDYSQQLGLMSRPAGYKVPAHIHNEVSRTITNTQEVLFIRNGQCLVKLFDKDLKVVDEINLATGDVILLAHGGHQIEMQSDCEILEVKQGPYAGENDKTHLELSE
jgi:hypothetical protein